MSISVEIRVLDPRLQAWGFPHYGSEFAAGVDLFACIDDEVRLEPQAPARLISSGFAVRIGNPDWCGLVVPRSGLGHKKGLVLGNGIGVVDPDYEGVCYVSAWNRSPPGKVDDDIIIRPGDRIAQLLFVRISHPHYEVVSEFTSTSNRGQRGFGSTGVGKR